MTSKRVLVTGGAGFIGSHLVDAYLERGWDVTVIDDLSTGDRGNLDPRARFIEGDIRQPASLDILDREKFDLVNHHAAQIDVRRSVADPADDASVNVVATVSLFERAAAAGVGKVIFASSGGAIYGEPHFYPQAEDHPQDPMSPYGCAKLAGEKYLLYYRAVRGIAGAALRYANVYGPRQNSRGEAGVVAIFAMKMLAGERPIVNGSGEQTRDFVFVEDVVRANMAVSELPIEGAFNVGTGVETSVNRIVALMQELTGTTGVEHAPGKLGEQMRSVLDATKLRSEAGLPQPVAFEEGLRRTVEWFREESGKQKK